MFRPNFSDNKKNVVQPMRIFCTSKISWNRISDWLPVVFHFGTESWEEQLKNHPVSLVRDRNVFCFLNNNNDNIYLADGQIFGGKMWPYQTMVIQGITGS